MIILDTHIWIWWVSNNSRLNPTQESHIAQHQSDGLGISIISCWEIAKAVETKGLQLTLPVEDWLNSPLDRSLPSIEEIEAELSRDLKGEL